MMIDREGKVVYVLALLLGKLAGPCDWLAYCLGDKTGNELERKDIKEYHIYYHNVNW